MRPLAEDEMRLVFEKLAKFVDIQIIMQLVEEDSAEPQVFRLHKDRVYILGEDVLKMAMCIPQKNLISAGVCLGKFTHSRKFQLGITCLDFLAQYAKYKVWVKAAGEQSFVYGNHVIKRHLGRITQDSPKHHGVVVLSMQDVPLGFGVLAKSTQECRGMNTEGVVVLRQADVGEYLRNEVDII
eukprot:Filipodium_phascolosomae@DN6592_c0_g1_i1.p1